MRRMRRLIRQVYDLHRTNKNTRSAVFVMNWWNCAKLVFIAAVWGRSDIIDELIRTREE